MERPPPVEGRFHWKWYFAFQHMADVNLSRLVAQREEGLLNRSNASEKIAMMMPSLWVQNELEEIAQSNISNLTLHRKRVTNFHTNLRHYVYPYLFREVPFTVEDYKKMPTFIDSKNHTNLFLDHN